MKKDELIKFKARLILCCKMSEQQLINELEALVSDCWESKLKHRSDKIELLTAFCMWATKQGYMDTDWKDEEPFAIDEFLKQKP